MPAYEEPPVLPGGSFLLCVGNAFMRSVKSVGDDAYIVPRADVGIRPYRP